MNHLNVTNHLLPLNRQIHQRIAHRISLLAVRSLYQELALYPKPGLVSLRDNGAHRDMDAATFVRSLFSLRGYFVAIAVSRDARSRIRRVAAARPRRRVAHAACHARHQHAPRRDIHARHTRRCCRLCGCAQHRTVR